MTAKDVIMAYFWEKPGDAAMITDLFIQGSDIRIYTMDEWRRILDEWWSGWEVFTELGPYCHYVKKTDGWVVEDHTETYQPLVKGYDAPGISSLCCRILVDNDEMVTAILNGRLEVPKALAAKLEKATAQGGRTARSDSRKAPARHKTASKNSSRQGGNMRRTTSTKRTATKRTTAKRKTAGARR